MFDCCGVDGVDSGSGVRTTLPPLLRRRDGVGSGVGVDTVWVLRFVTVEADMSGARLPE